MTALRAEGCGLPFGRRLKKGARLRRRLCRRVVFASLRGATAALPPRVADCRSAAILIKSALRDWLSVSYGMISILRIGSLRSPPLWWLHHHLSPASGGTTTRAKLRVTYEKIASRSFVLPPLAGEVPRSGQGGCFSLVRQGGCRFYTNWRLL